MKLSYIFLLSALTILNYSCGGRCEANCEQDDSRFNQQTGEQVHRLFAHGDLFFELCDTISDTIIVLNDNYPAPEITIYNQGNDYHIIGSSHASTRDSVRVLVPTKHLREISMIGDGMIASPKVFKATTLRLNLSGNAAAVLQLDVQKLDLQATGIFSALLTGFAMESKITFIGHGEIDASDLVTETSAIKNVGNGTVIVSAGMQVECRNYGSGEISYRGEAEAKVAQNIGTGTIKHD